MQHLVTKEVSTRVLVTAVQDLLIVEGLIRVLLIRVQDIPTIADSIQVLIAALVEVLMQPPTEGVGDFLTLDLVVAAKDIRLQEVEAPTAVKEAILHLVVELVVKEATLLPEVMAAKEAILQVEVVLVREGTILLAAQ